MITLKPGKYFIGDPCYVIDKNWDKVCDQLFSKENTMDDENEVKIDSHSLFIGGTAYGDGTYHSKCGSSFSVDSGCLGATPFELWEKDIKIKNLNDLGKIIETDINLTCSNHNGDFIFGEIEIETNDDYAEDFYDEDEDEDEDE